MMKITINLATRKYPGKGLGIALPTAIFLLSLSVFLYLSGRLRDSADAIGRLEKRIVEISQKKIERPAQVEELIPGNVAAVSEIAGQRGFSWIEALDNIEKSIPSNVSLTSIQPTFREGGVKISGYARDFGSLSRFINNLEGLVVYERVFLVNQSVKEVEEGKEAIVFNINIEGGR
jgi:Tfp pilus assembly protein PilN